MAGRGGTTGAAGTTGAGGRGGAGTTGSAGSTGTAGTTGSAGSSGSGISTQGITCTAQTWDAAPIGWATVSGGTTGGGNATPMMVSSASAFTSAASGTGAAVIYLSGTISGTFKVGSNKTIWGLCGAEVDGSLNLGNSKNVIVRNLKVVGYNCTDSPSDCSSGADAVHVENAQHMWFDHMDVEDGSDGNLDINNSADFVTVSWTKFHYSSKRTDPMAGATGHRFSNLIGSADTTTSDAGHLNSTFHHVWWADNVNQRMPRVRFGKVHIFNSLYTATGDSACIEVGVSCNIRSENNVFSGVTNTVDSSHSDAASIIQSIGNQGSSTNIGGAAFTPSYAYTLDPVGNVQSAVQSGAGVH
jgi:pectate lyase